MHQAETYLRTIPEDQSDTSSIAAGRVSWRLPTVRSPRGDTGSTRAIVDDSRSIISSTPATLPDPVSHAPAAASTEKCSQFFRPRNWRLIGVSVSLIGVVILALFVVGIYVGRQPSVTGTGQPSDLDTSPATRYVRTQAPTGWDDTLQPTFDLHILRAIDDSISRITSQEDLLTDGTPQNTARNWMVKTDYLRDDVVNYGPERILQRYIVAVLNFALGAEVFPDNSVCYWEGITCDSKEELWVESINYRSRNRTGFLPSEITRLRSLKELDLSENSIGGTIPSFAASQQLEYLDLSENQFDGTFRSSLWFLPNLRYLYVHDTLLTGILVPPDWEARMNTRSVLSDVRLYRNNLSGSIPAEWFQGLEELEIWITRDNLMTGSIPHPLPSQLKLIDLSSNLLEGTIPDIANGLEMLYLDGNRLTGPLPNGSGMALRELMLYHNSLTGTIPNDYGASWRSLDKLILYSNFLSGEIPPQFGYGWTNLTKLYLHQTALEGSLGPNNEASCSDVWPRMELLRVNCTRVQCMCCRECLPRR